MKRSIEDQIKLMALKQTAPPPPTLLAKPGSGQEDLIDTELLLGNFCGVEIPTKYGGWYVSGIPELMEFYGFGVREVLWQIIHIMYCRPRLDDGTCEGLAATWDVMRPWQTVTDRDLPLFWLREHPEFNQDDPNTWGSVFGPGGLAERIVRSINCQQGVSSCHSDEDVNAMVGFVRQLYTVRCGFLITQGGSCCTFDDFGTAKCTPTISSSCPGVYTAGGSCNGPNPCGLASNQIQQNDQTKKQTPIMDMVMSTLKGK